MPRNSLHSLRQLAGLYGVQTAYSNTTKRRQPAEADTLLTVLRLLGAPVTSAQDVDAALHLRPQALWQRSIEPVIVSWDGQPTVLEIRLPSPQASAALACQIHTESGEHLRWEVDLATASPLLVVDLEGVAYHTKRLTIAAPLPVGEHRLTIDVARQHFEALIIAAPQRAYTPVEDAAHKTWGAFLPPYALHSAQSWGSGDFSALEALADWLAEHGGGVLATLPLLSSFFTQPFDPSPYVPASRLFWNKFYIDVLRAPGLDECTAARQILQATTTQALLADLRTAPLVDYQRQMAMKRQVLETLAEWFFTINGGQHDDFRHYVASHPAVEDYALFQATVEHQQAPWPACSQCLREGIITPHDADDRARRYPLYAQWVAQTQMQTLAARSKEKGVRLYLDLPLGVHPHSYDVRRHPSLFIREAAAGAPPDAYYTKGQNWGFPPLHPEAIRLQGYQYCIAFLRHQLRHTGLLRIDHVMGLHRLFWIPQGLQARQGVYVRYAAEELYAILNLESHRYQVCMVGESLGTVPAYVNSAMARHHLHRMYVVQYELTPSSQGALRRIPRHAVASLNTHDMPPFAAYWEGLDITDRLDQGLLTPAEAEREQAERRRLLHALQRFLHERQLLAAPPAELPAVMSACLAYLSASPAQVVLINLEDLWLETQPQNFPGTHAERQNWRQKAHYSPETFQHMPQILATLRTINHIRKQEVSEA
jgi:4-alpha-glucanotransferase